MSDQDYTAKEERTYHVREVRRYVVSVSTESNRAFGTVWFGSPRELCECSTDAEAQQIAKALSGGVEPHDPPPPKFLTTVTTIKHPVKSAKVKR